MEANDFIKVSVTEAVDCITKLDTDTPAMCWGEPGCGKTKTIESRFLKMKDGKGRNYKVVHVLAGQSEPADIGGIPFNFEDKYAKYVVPWWGFYASTHPAVPKEYQGPMVLFFDDIVTAHEQTQAAFYKVVDEKRIGDLQIRDNVRIIAAGNRIDDMSAVTDMPKALCNRFIHFYVQPDVEAWLNWATTSGVHPHVTFFVRQNQNRISDFEDAKKSTEVHSWATPRTWEMLSRCLFKLEEAGLRNSDTKTGADYEAIMVQGCIGALSTEFLATVRTKYQTVPMEEIIKHPNTAEVPEEIDRLYATVCNMEYWFTNPKHHKHYKEYITYTRRLPEDMGVILSRQIITTLTNNSSSDEALAAEIWESKEMNDFLEKCVDEVFVSMND